MTLAGKLQDLHLRMIYSAMHVIWAIGDRFAHPIVHLYRDSERLSHTDLLRPRQTSVGAPH